MPGRKLTIDVAYEYGDEVNYQGCNGAVIGVALRDGVVMYEVQFLDNNGNVVTQWFRVFEIDEGHEP